MANDRLDRIENILAELAQAQAKTEAQLAKTDAQLAKTDAQLAKTDAKLNRLAEMYGGVANNNGHYAEETFYRSLEKNPIVGKIRFDEVSTHWKRRSAGKEAEYDIVLVNGSAAMVVEVKYRLNPGDVEKFSTQKLPLFKELIPDFQPKTLYGAVGGLSIAPDALERARELGLFLLTKEGEELKLLNDQARAV